MQHAGIPARRDDRLVAHLRAAAGEFGEQLRLEFVFHHAGLEHRQHALQAGIGGLDRPPQEFDFGGTFDSPERA